MPLAFGGGLWPNTWSAGVVAHSDLRNCTHIQSSAEYVDLRRTLALSEHVGNLHPLRTQTLRNPYLPAPAHLRPGAGSCERIFPFRNGSAVVLPFDIHLETAGVGNSPRLGRSLAHKVGDGHLAPVNGKAHRRQRRHQRHHQQHQSEQDESEKGLHFVRLIIALLFRHTPSTYRRSSAHAVGPLPTYTVAMTSETDLLAPLLRYWGYDSFRPLQEQIVRSLLGARDTCVVMPTGGGKSLCYQLPALVSGRTAVVISPLIALMQDQAAQLAQMGIPAAVLNSSQSQRTSNRESRKKACAGRIPSAVSFAGAAGAR